MIIEIRVMNIFLFESLHFVQIIIIGHWKVE